MTLWRRITPAIVRVSLLSALVGTLTTFILTGRYALGRFTEDLQEVMAHVRQDPFVARCEASPEGWRVQMPSGSELATFDIARLPPDGPDARLLARILAGESRASRILVFQDFGGAMLLRLAPEGPCSLLQLRWKVEAGSPRRRALLGAGALAIVSALLTGLSCAFIVVRPLIVRMQRLEGAARLLGRGPEYASAADPGEDELGAISRVLDDANGRIWETTRRLVEQNDQLQDHLADIAHDLKTPLTAVQLTLEQVARAQTDAATREMMTRSLDDCVYLAAMMDNLRVGTALRDGLDPGGGAVADAGEQVALVVRRLALLGRFKQVEVNMARPDRAVRVSCRALALERVIDNLVYNAVSHAGAGGHVAVVLEADGECFRLTVLDDGPGVSPVELAALGMRRFRGTGAELRAPRGSGLGLSIVSEICRRCGWDLRFESNRPTGLKVTVSGPEQGAPAGV
ncbi:MAG: hypothetical protein BGO98_06345 [Myxococcales bacterium 68-20]|nr:MAG: hypothetical protein BGO98_06345 [Myxococcales bacterium 68-20]